MGALKPVVPLTPLFDSHAHINAGEFADDLDAVIERMKVAGLVGCVTVGCDCGEENTVLALARRYPGFVHAAWALHPEYEDRREPTVEEIASICSAPEMVAVGETGLDYYWCEGDLAWQRERFVRHIAAAKLVKKPVIVHAREAEADAVDILEREGAADVGFVLHCYGGDIDTARRAAALGGLISFTGVLTFKNADDLREVAAALPLGALMVETDCPYMAPVPWRGRRNEPAYVGAVARTLADLHNTTPEHVAAVTTETARRFFRLSSSNAYHS